MFSYHRQKLLSVFIVLLIILGFSLLPSSLFSSDSQSHQEIFRSGYLFFRRAEDLFRRGELEKARENYRRAEQVWLDLRTDHPGWYPEGVSSKLNGIRKRIRETERILAEKRSWENPLRIHFLDVGQGDSALIQCPDGSNIVIDGGPMSAYPFLVNYLQEAGVEKIDLMIATHPDGDHIGGLPKLLKVFPVDTLLDSGKEHTTKLYQRYLSTIDKSLNTKFKLGRAGDRYNFGKVELLILHPSSVLPDRNNDCSIMVKLRYGKESFLFTGDAEEKAERELMNRGFTLRSTVLKVGHHGSKSSTSPRFLTAVSPRAAVISAGSHNRWGHPTPEVMRRLQMGGIEIYRTDLQGTILFLSNGAEYRVEFPGKAVYPDYEIPPEHEGKIIANKETLIFHLPEGRSYRKVPPEDRDYFETEADALAAGYYKSWY